MHVRTYYRVSILENKLIFKMKVFCYILLLTIIKCVRSATILGIIPVPSYSHQVVFRPLWRELSLRGHQLTVITTDPMNNIELTNLTEINIHDVYDTYERNLFESFAKPMWQILYEYNNLTVNLLDRILTNSQVYRLVNDQTIHFDLVMIQSYHTAALAFASRFQCPLILLSSLDAAALVYSEIRNPVHPVLHPDYMLPLSTDMSFFERLSSVWNAVFTKLYFNYLFIPSQQLLVQKHFGKDYPLIQDVLKNYSLFFININDFFHPIRPLLPNIIKIGGGTHLRNQKPLPSNLQYTLDSAKNGFIYFSLGSNVKSTDLSDITKKEILNTFKELPYTVLWKFESESLPDISTNLVIAKWFPQQAVLRHPNIKLFITQGGLQSLEEAIFNHIPILGIPVMSDQVSNIAKIVLKGLGLSLHYKNVSKESFKSVILEVINNPKYRSNIREVAIMLEDQPETGLDRAVWWTEYVLRHKGAHHLRNPGLDLPWYQDYLLDIYGFLLLTLVILVSVIFTGFKLVVKITNRLKIYFKVKVS